MKERKRTDGSLAPETAIRMKLDLNNAWPQWLDGQLDAKLQVLFEEMFGWWHACLAGSRGWTPDDYPEPCDYREAFLRFCAHEFDRVARTPNGPACAWPRKVSDG